MKTYSLKSATVIEETPTRQDGNYTAIINVELELSGYPELKIFTPEFTVVSNNSQTGTEVDAQRQKEIDDYIKQINNL